MSVSTSIINSQQFVLNGNYLHRIKYIEGRKQSLRVAIPSTKERIALLEIFKNENLSDTDKWKNVANKWNYSINKILIPLVSKKV